MNISIVMPNHNRFDALPLTFDALVNQTYPMNEFEVIVVDQDSTDGSRDFVLNYPAPFQLRLLPQEGKFGISVARNGGTEIAKGRLIILLDADIIADKGLVAAHDDLHQKFKYPVLGCGRLLPYKPCYKSYIDQVANPDAGLDRGDTPEDFPFYHAFGGHLSYTKQTFNRVGPFDPELRGAEDTEFAYRASKLDVRIKNCCQAIGYHNHSRSLDERRKRGYAYSMMIPQLIELHPELRGKIPGMAELEPLDWTNDPLSLKRAKMRAIFWSLKFNRTLLASFLEFCERYRAMPRFAKAGYYRLILGDMRAGAVNHLGHNGD